MLFLHLLFIIHLVDCTIARIWYYMNFMGLYKNLDMGYASYVYSMEENIYPYESIANGFDGITIRFGTRLLDY